MKPTEIWCRGRNCSKALDRILLLAAIIYSERQWTGDGWTMPLASRTNILVGAFSRPGSNGLLNQGRTDLHS